MARLNISEKEIIAKALRDRGYTMEQAGHVLNCSHNRVYQMVAKADAILRIMDDRGMLDELDEYLVEILLWRNQL